jgi:hypothetical protein
MTWLGGISYSVYLWHWPLLILAQARWPEIPGWALACVGLSSVPLAWLTKKLLEDPVRFAPALSRRTSLALTMGVVAMSLSVVAGLAVIRSVPELDRDADVPGARALVANPAGKDWRMVGDPTRFYTASGTIYPPPALAPLDVPQLSGCQLPIYDSEIRTDCVRGKRKSDTSVALLGDSKMAQWTPAFAEIARQEGWRLELYLKSACAFSEVGVPDYCAAFNRKVLDVFADHGAPDYAVVSVRGSSYDETTGGLTDELAELEALGTEVIVLADNISPNEEALYRCVEQHEDDYLACSFDRAKGVRTSGAGFLLETAEALDAPFVDLNDWICPPGDTCPPVIADTLVFRQGSHVTRTYIKTLTPILHRELARIGVARTPVADIRLNRE